MSGLLPGARRLTPLKQGDLSCLCGLYSMLNAIQLVLYPRRLTQDHQQRLFMHGVALLARHRALKRVLGSGMDERLWEVVGQALLTTVNAELGSCLALKRLLTNRHRRNRRQAILAIERAVYSGSPVLICLGGTLDHYTVICGCSGRSLSLFDSSGLHWVRMDTTGMGEDSGSSRWIWPECVYAMLPG